jgi:hypothetical protein
VFRRGVIGLMSVMLFPLVGVGVASAHAEDVQSAPSHDRVTMCHIPHNEPLAARTITVSPRKVDAHLAQGDTLGPCPTVP